MFILPVTWLAGGLIGLMTTGWTSPPEEIIGALSLLVLGILIASDIALPATAVAGLAALLGGAHGFFNGVAMREAEGARELLGAAATLFVIVALASALAVTARPVWARIVCRVAGSWIAASGLLWTGWVLHGAK